MTPKPARAKSARRRGLGSRVHLTETCAVDEAEDAQAGAMPQLIVQVETTVANVQDVERTATIQEDLAQHQLLPDEHLVDSGYVDAQLLVSSQQDSGIRLVGPVLADNSWQAKAGKGFDVGSFHGRPGKLSSPRAHRARSVAAGVRQESASKWSLPKRSVPLVRCAATARASLTTGRVLHVRPQDAHEARPPRRREQQTPEFRQEYARPAGIEATLSQAVRGMGIRRASYDGLPKVQLQQVLTAVAINLVRIDAVLTQTPRGKTRRSHARTLSIASCSPRLGRCMSFRRFTISFANRVLKGGESGMLAEIYGISLPSVS